jgi:hypothetical protein
MVRFSRLLLETDERLARGRITLLPQDIERAVLGTATGRAQFARGCGNAVNRFGLYPFATVSPEHLVHLDCPNFAIRCVGKWSLPADDELVGLLFC